MEHIFKHGKSLHSRTLLLLHGTGGTEQDLLPLAKVIDPVAHVLSVRGNVLENGMPRFFRRLSEGVFDEEDLIYRTEELKQFLDKASETYEFDREQVFAIGYSNGANIAASLFFHYENVLAGAMLHHPMVPRRNIELPSLTDVPIFIGAGTNDIMCPPEETEELNKLFMVAGANVTVHWENKGHQLTTSEVKASKHWYDQLN